MASIQQTLIEHNLKSKERATKCDTSYLDATQSQSNVRY